MNPVFVGTIEKGILRLDLPGSYEKWLITLEGKRITCEIKRFRKNRTDQQNKYWWGVVIDILSNEVGFEPEEMHDVIKRKFLPVISKKGDFTSGKSTARLTTIEFVDLIERVQRWASIDLQCYIPDPNEEVKGE